jgi:hypothetical protein
LEVKSDWNAIAVSHTPGYIYYQKETGEVTMYNTNTHKEDYTFTG